jgi:hypothetical protein
MGTLARFFGQPNRAYRDFQVVYSLLTLNFIVPSLTYLVDPNGTYARFVAIGAMLGEHGYPSPEASYFWRFLGVSNVFTLGVMCAMLQWNLRRYWPILPALCVLKAGTSLQFLGNYFFGIGHRAFLAIGLFDALTTVAFIVFATRAHRAMGEDAGRDEGLVPRPR